MIFQTTKRRSTRMSVRHKACNAALFSDEETVEPEEMTIEVTSSHEPISPFSCFYLYRPEPSGID